MQATALETLKPASGGELKGLKGPVSACLARMKKGLAAIAEAKISQQLGREEETK